MGVVLRAPWKYRLLLAGLWCAVVVADECELLDAQISFVQKKALKLGLAAGTGEFKKRADSSKDSSCLQEGQKKALLDRIHNDTSLNMIVDGLPSRVDAKIEQPNATGGALWITYHKSGSKLMVQLLSLMAPLFGGSADIAPLQHCLTSSPGGYTRRSVQEKCVNSSISIVNGTNFWLQIDGQEADWTFPSNARVVYAFRDPIKLVLSGYRYHAEGREPRWESSVDGHIRSGVTKCFNCAQADFDLLFSACPNKSSNYSYLELLSSYPEEDGVLVEFIRARRQLQAMTRNLKRFINDRNTLVLSVEHFSTDFNRTATCMLRFFGHKDDAQWYSSTLSHLQAANIDSGSYNSSVTTRSQHVTRGDYDNTKVEKILKEHPILGPQFAEVRAAAEAIYQRQFKMYGCPEPRL